jgi:uncharacterized membrane protein HdeD (DUF308 family)
MSEVSNKQLANELSRKMNTNWKFLLIIGALTLLLGIVGIGMNVTMTIVSIAYIAFFIILGGILHLIDAFIVDGWKNKLFGALIGVTYLIAGSLMFRYPAASATWFTLFIAAFFLFVGAFRIFIGFKLRKENKGWAWTVVSGLAAILLGILIYAQWPVSGLWVIGLFVSIELIMQGISTITVAMAVRSLQRRITKAAQ